VEMAVSSSKMLQIAWKMVRTGNPKKIPQTKKKKIPKQFPTQFQSQVGNDGEVAMPSQTRASSTTRQVPKEALPEKTLLFEIRRKISSLMDFNFDFSFDFNFDRSIHSQGGDESLLTIC